MSIVQVIVLYIISVTAQDVTNESRSPAINLTPLWLAIQYVCIHESIANLLFVIVSYIILAQVTNSPLLCSHQIKLIISHIIHTNQIKPFAVQYQVLEQNTNSLAIIVYVHSFSYFEISPDNFCSLCTDDVLAYCVDKIFMDGSNITNFMLIIRYNICKIATTRMIKAALCFLYI